MAKQKKTKGVKKNKIEMQVATANIIKRTDRGVLLAGLHIRRVAMKKTPRRVSNLINSAYVVTSSGAEEGGGAFPKPTPGMKENHAKEKSASKSIARMLGILGGPTAMVGFSAIYALFVHENPQSGAPGVGRADDEGLPAYARHSRVGGWKFLENAIKEEASTVVAILKKEID